MALSQRSMRVLDGELSGSKSTNQQANIEDSLDKTLDQNDEPSPKHRLIDPRATQSQPGAVARILTTSVQKCILEQTRPPSRKNSRVL
jgi:hypothetical protein